MGEWPTLSMREAGVTLIDCDHRTPTAVPTGYPYVTIPQLEDGHIVVSTARRISREDFEQWTRKAHPIPHDVVLSRRTNPGVTAFVPQGLEFALGQNLVLLRSDGQTVYPPYLRWLVRGPEWWVQIERFRNVGAVFDSLKCADIPNFRLPIPQIDEQRRIAEILSALDDKIELNRRMGETLEAMARALFKSWFTVGTGTEVGGWRPSVVGREFEVTMGQSPPGSTYNSIGDGLPFYQGRADFGSRFPARRVYCTAPTRTAQAGDTLLSVRAPVGDINIATETCAIGRGVAAVRHRSGSRTYTFEFMHSMRGVLDEYNGHGTVFGAIGGKDLSAMECLAPPDRLVRDFEDQARPLDERLENVERQCRTLAETRDTLLPRLLSGELEVAA